MTSAQKSRMNELIRKYESRGGIPGGEAFLTAFQRFIRSNRESLFDVTFAATSAHISLTEGPDDVDPLLLKAIYQTNPSLTQGKLFTLDEASLQGAVNSAKGTYFEYLVVERLNSGEQVGPLVLEKGQRAVLAEIQNQPGWDIRIVDESNVTIDYLQLKATDSVGYIQEALNKYPDISILATSEVAASGLVLDSGISEQALRAKVGAGVDAADVSLTESFLDYFNPLLPLAVIASYEGYQLLIGNQSLDQFKLALARRGQRMVVTQLVGAAVYMADGGVLTIPSAIAGGFIFDHHFNQLELRSVYQKHHERLLSLRLQQQERCLSAQGDI